MALVVKDRVKETTTTTGTGTITLAGAADGYQSFSVIGNANTTYYAIVGGNEWEVGVGTYTSSGTTLSRDTVLESSNSGNLVSFSSGEKQVFCTYPAEKSAFTDDIPTNNNELTNGAGYITGNQTITLSGDASGSGTTSIAVTVADDSHNHTSLTNVTALSGTDWSLQTNVTTGVYDDATSNANYSRLNIDSLHTNGIGVGQTWIEGSALDFNATAYIGTGKAGGQTYKTVTINNPVAAVNGSGSNTIWHAGNDGSGSGLDADTVDGIQASSFAQRANNSLYQHPVWDNRSTDTSTDLGGPAVAFEFKSNSTDNLSDGGNYHGVMTFQQWSDSSGGDTNQLAFTDNQNMWLRGASIGGTWGSWNKLWHAGNDGSGSGLDADTVDGNHASAFVAVSGDTMTGNLTIDQGTAGDANLTLRADTDNNDEGDHPSMRFKQDGDAVDWRIGIGKDDTDTSTTSNNLHITALAGSGIDLRYSDGTNSYKIWREDNDGSGSGLDADLLDGQHASAFAAASHTHSYLSSATDSEQTAHFGDVQWNQGTVRINSDPRNNEPGYDSDLSMIHWWSTTAAGANYGRVGHALYNGGTYQYLHTKSGQNHLYINNNVVWNAGNDGSGSGLDADLLDGVQASSFLRSDAADTKTAGNLIFADNVRANFGASSDLNIYHNGSSSYIDNNTNHLYIRNNVDGDDGGNIYIQAKSGEHSIILYDDSYVSLYDNGVERLRVDSPIYAYADIRLQGSGYDLIYDKGTYITTLSSVNPASQNQTIYLPDASGYASVKSFSQGHELSGVSGITLTPANNWRKIEIVLTVDSKVLSAGSTTPRVGIDMTANGSAVSWRQYKDELHEYDYYNQVWQSNVAEIYSYYFTKESIMILNLWRTDDTNDCRVMFDLQIKEGTDLATTDAAKFYKISGSTSAAISKLNHQILIGLGGGTNWNGVEYFTTVEYHN